MDPSGFSFSSSWLVNPDSPALSDSQCFPSRQTSAFDCLEPTPDSSDALNMLDFTFLSQHPSDPITTQTLYLSPSEPSSPRSVQSHDFPWYSLPPALPTALSSQVNFPSLSRPPSPSPSVLPKRRRSSVETSISDISSSGSGLELDAERKRRRRETNKKSAKAFRLRRKSKLENLQHETERRDAELARLRLEVDSLRQEQTRLQASRRV